MGLFDTVRIPIECPVCGTIHDDWQTKDLECLMHTYRLEDVLPMREGVVRIYTHCPHRIQRDTEITKALGIHGYKHKYLVWLDVFIPVKDGMFVRDVNQWKMIVHPRKGYHSSITFQEVKVRKFNYAKKWAELERVGTTIEELVGRELTAQLEWDEELGMVRSRISLAKSGQPKPL